ncbi:MULTISPECIES: hypothetical protein [Eubacterium]|uniref:Uncharacterized protein n=1 Tax=Eubacterium barkeri TaxID=1528 RepID=A0A1H3D359_EUBBA|nr:hypothetical protein [Eubacterium barkeri]SDX60786.1 hypothetical protein SAMN04488579_10472 [Eubacterium barkeri]
MERQKINWIPVVLYVFAVIFGLYAIYALVNTSQYIGQMLASGYITMADSFTDIIAYFVTNVAVYVFYTLVLGSFGYVVDVLQRGVKVKPETPAREKAHTPEAKDASDEEADVLIVDEEIEAAGNEEADTAEDVIEEIVEVTEAEEESKKNS